MGVIGGATDPQSFGVLPETREPPSDSYSDLTSEDFMEIILAELSNQDPLEPNDSQALIDQISSIRAIESDLNLVEQFESLVDDSAFSSASSLIGGVVSGRATTGERVEGEVVSVIRSGQETLLGLADGRRVSVADVDEVSLPDLSGLFDTPPPAEDPVDETPVDEDDGSEPDDKSGDGSDDGSGSGEPEPDDTAPEEEPA